MFGCNPLTFLLPLASSPVLIKPCPVKQRMVSQYGVMFYMYMFYCFTCTCFTALHVHVKHHSIPTEDMFLPDINQ